MKFGVKSLIIGYVLALVFLALGLTQCNNSPYPVEELEEKTLYYFLREPPNKMDPAKSFFNHEAKVLEGIYEAPFAYHYLKRPYVLVPRLAVEMPTPVFYDKGGNVLEGDPPADQVDRVVYDIKLRQDVKFQPHPCFAKDENGEFIYRNLKPGDIDEDWERPVDFEHQGTRQMTAHDMVRGVRRLADERLESPIYSTMSRYILGMEDVREEIVRRVDDTFEAAGRKGDKKQILVDYLTLDCPGVEAADDFTFRLTLKRKYPQMRYWMAKHFFAPIPQEALDFYAEPVIADRQMVMNRWPVGTGAYYMETYRPNEKMVMVKNPNFREMLYPSEGMPGDAEQGFLKDAGKRLPLNDRVVLNIEREGVPRWNKFLQGYYDVQDDVAEAVFGSSVVLSSSGDMSLSQEMLDRGINLVKTVDSSTYCFGFNMVDEVVGGLEPEKKKLRQAMSIVLDYNEFISIFLNERGLVGQGPIPPGLFGYKDGEEGANSYISEWNPETGVHDRRSLEDARQLMVEAGYPGGRDSEGRPLVLTFDFSTQGNPEYEAHRQWFRKKLALLGIEMRERGSELGQFREKVNKGEWQLYRLGWLADYPDPENYLFLFYGPNSKVIDEGENNVNYQNPEYDKLFEQVESMADGPKRLAVIDKMVAILQEDCPWVWGYHRILFGYSHEWCGNFKMHVMGRDWFQYLSIDPEKRAEKQAEWNKPIGWPIVVVFALLGVIVLPGVVIDYRRRERGL